MRDECPWPQCMLCMYPCGYCPACGEPVYYPYVKYNCTHSDRHQELLVAAEKKIQDQEFKTKVWDEINNIVDRREDIAMREELGERAYRRRFPREYVSDHRFKLVAMPQITQYYRDNGLVWDENSPWWYWK